MITRLNLKKAGKDTGEWIDVKDQQRVRDEKDVHSYSNEGMTAEGQRYNIVKHRIATAAVRIKAWSVTNDDGKVIPWPGPEASFKQRTDVIESLYEKQLDSISDAITTHLVALAKDEADAKKETQDGATDSEQSSPSAS